MTRRGIREHIFLIIFKAEFNSREDMEEQIRFSVDRIGVTEEDPDDIGTADFGRIRNEDLSYIEAKSKKILEMLPVLDKEISRISDGWQIGRIGKPELAILRIAVYEMLYDDAIPFRVAINEAVELAKKYCNPEAGGFINALLAKVEEPA